MDKNERTKRLSELPTTVYGRALREFLEEELTLLNDITKVASWEETLGNQKAVTIIRKLFSFMEPRKEGTPRKNEYV